MADKEGPDVEHVVGEVEKNANEVWRVSLARFRGHNLANLRGFVIRGRDGGRVNIATRNGVVIRPAQIPQVIELLQRAHAEAKARGLIDVVTGARGHG
jgi:hypothetical protein